MPDVNVFAPVPLAGDVRAEAPARVNLIGEHTDYHGGFVLPTVLPQKTQVWGRLGDNGQVRATSAAFPGGVGHFRLGEEEAVNGWIDYVQGVTWVLRRAGLTLGGFDVVIESSIPAGAGVSSSAALAVSLVRMLRNLFALPVDDVDVAKLAQLVETDFVGAPVGIMDQMACSLGQPGEALFLDTHSLVFERVPLPNHAELLVIDSGVVHRHASGQYSQRRDESFAASAQLGIAQLRELSVHDLPKLGNLPPMLMRRARHIVTENQRVIDMVDALRAGQVERAGALMNASHASLRDDYEVSTDDVDRLVSLVQAHPGAYGARLTGGGFGGAVVGLVQVGSAAEAGRAVAFEYGRDPGRCATVLLAGTAYWPSPQR